MSDLLKALLETRSALLADVSPAGAGGASTASASTGSAGSDRLLIRSDLTGVMQLYELASPGPALADADRGGDSRALRPITDLAEPVGNAAYVPGTRTAIAEVDRGGDERHQLYLVDLDGEPSGPEDLRAITADPRFGHHLAGVSPDGSLVAYVSNRQNGVDFDLWVCDLGSSEHRCLYAGGAWCQAASGFSPDGRWVSVLRPGARPLDMDLLLVEVASGRVLTVLPHPDEAAGFGPPVWWGATTIFVSSNVGADRAAVVRFDLDTGAAVPITDGGFDATPAAAAPGAVLVVVENRNGASRAVLVDTPGSPGEAVELPLVEPGVILSDFLVPRPRLSADGCRLYYTLSTPRRPCDVWCFDRSTGETARLTSSPAGTVPEALVSPEPAEVASFDGELIPLRLYRPAGGEPAATPADATPFDATPAEEAAADALPAEAPSGVGKPPAVLLVHGGPESQAMCTFNPIIQALAADGYAVIVPNVRGSTGYGKRYAALDDTTKRLDSVRDLAAVHEWLSSEGIDDERAALWGGSYGGYMVLAGLAFQPSLWAAGVDIVGISDLVTFLENTSEYRRAHREREYGSLETDREFLARASPLRHADDMRAPLFMIHGRNDPRVPVGETEQLAASLDQRGVRCELVIYDDEGHGLARLANRLDAYPRAFAFLEKVLKD